MSDLKAILVNMAAHRDHYHHGNLREALVDAAQCLISEVGVAGLSLRKVAKHAGVSQAAPYHHFPNKDALLAEVAFRGFSSLTAGMEKSFTTVDDPIERIQALGQVYVEFGTRNPAVYRLMFGAEQCRGEDFPALKEAASGCFRALLQAIQAGQQAGAFLGDDPAPVGLALWSSMHGLVSLLHANFHNGTEEMAGLVVTPELFLTSTMAFVVGGLTGSPDGSEQ